MAASSADIAHSARETMRMPTDNAATITHENVAKHIIDIIGRDDDITGLSADSALQSHGIDSLKIMSLVFTLEDHYHIFLDEEDADDLRTIDDLAALVVRRVEERS
jgi:acyl carrier protein